jgi:uncharacterized membrane-anchored protein YitT (DUF2179 family)
MSHISFGVEFVLGVLDVVLAVGYAGLTINLIVQNRRPRNRRAITLFVLQLVMVPIPLLIFSLSLILQSGKLHPILQLAYLAIQAPFLFAVLKDWGLAKTG